MNEQNRKVKQTNAMLSNAFFQLLKTKELEEITINDLIRLSSVSRSTFYNHYKSPTALFEKLGNDMLAGMNNAFVTMRTDCNKGFGMLVAIIKLEKEKNKMFLRYKPFVDNLTNRIKNAIFQIDQNELISEYKSHGIVAALTDWALSDYKENIEIIGGLL